MSKSGMPKPVPFVVLSKVASLQHLFQHKPTTLHIRRHNEPIILQPKHLLHDIHNGTSKLPQSQPPQFILQKPPIHPIRIPRELIRVIREIRVQQKTIPIRIPRELIRVIREIRVQ